MTNGIPKSIEQVGGGATLTLLLVAPLGITPGLRNVLVTLLAGFGLYMWLQERRAITFPVAPLVVWVAVMLASALWSWAPWGTLRNAALEVLFPAGAMLATFVLSSRGWSRMFWLSILVGLPIIALAGAGIVLRSGTEGIFAPSPRQSWMAAYPGVGVATTVAVLALPFCLAGLLQSERQMRVVSAISLCAILAVGVLSQNRAFWPALALTGGVQTFLFIRQQEFTGRLRKWLVLVAIGLVGFLVAGWVLTLNMRTLEPGSQETVATVTSDIRWAAWQVWIEKGREHPVLGFGYGKRQIPGQLESTYKERLEKIGYGVAGHGHNLILNIWLQTGLVGLIAFLALLVAMTRYLLDSRRGSGNISCGGTIGVSVMVALLAKNMTDDFLGHAIAVYFWLLMGVAAGLHHAPRSTERD